MNFSLETAALSSSIGLCLLSVSFLYVATIVPTKKPMKWWSLGFIFLAIDNFLVFFHPIDNFGLLLPFWEAVHIAFVCLTVIGVLHFLGAKINYWVLGLLAGIVEGWGIYSTLAKPEFFSQTIPSSLISSGLILYAGFKLLNYRPVASESGYKFAGWAFVIWSINRPTFSFILFFPEYGPWGYMASQFSAMCMGIGLIVAVLERQRKEAVAAETVAQQNRSQFLRVLETSPVGIAVVEPRTEQILFANAAFQEMARRKEVVENWLEKGEIYLSQYLKPVGTVSWQSMMSEGVAKGEGAGATEFRGVSHDGEPLWFVNTVRAIQWEGRIVAQNTLVDITERKNSEQALAIAKDEAENASAAKTKFLAAASHDLRQPVQALMLFAGTLKSLDHTPETITVLNRIFLSLDALRSLLDTLLDISRLEAGLVRPHKLPLRLGDILARLEGEYVGQAVAQGLMFRYVPVSLNVMSDQTLLEDILRNLLSNALKYTDKGRILLGCRRYGDKVRVEVWDTGRGIAEDHQKEIFKDFHQIIDQNNKRNRGLGLGLSIVQRLSGLLGTEVKLQSKMGQGSVFSIELDVTDEVVVDEVPLLQVNEKVKSRLVVAVVDDDINILESMSQLLLDRGHDIIAFDGVDVEREELPVGGDLPDLIIADHRLIDGASGLDAVKVLRTHYKKIIPAIILTGDTSPQKLSELTQTGIPVLHKPVRPSELIDIAERVGNQKG